MRVFVSAPDAVGPTPQKRRYQELNEQEHAAFPTVCCAHITFDPSSLRGPGFDGRRAAVRFRTLVSTMLEQESSGNPEKNKFLP
jgi:hypothetical protein